MQKVSADFFFVFHIESWNSSHLESRTRGFLTMVRLFIEEKEIVIFFVLFPF